MKGDGDSASHMADDGGSVFCFSAALPKVSAHDSAGIEGVKERAAGELRNAAYVAFGEHFIRHRGIGHIGRAFSETGSYSFLIAQFIDGVGNILSYKSAQVAGVIAVAAGLEHLAHIVVHIVDTGKAGCEQASSGHNYVYVFQFDTILFQGAKDGFCAHPFLIHHIGEAG